MKNVVKLFPVIVLLVKNIFTNPCNDLNHNPAVDSENILSYMQNSPSNSFNLTFTFDDYNDEYHMKLNYPPVDVPELEYIRMNISYVDPDNNLISEEFKFGQWTHNGVIEIKSSELGNPKRGPKSCNFSKGNWRCDFTIVIGHACYDYVYLDSIVPVSLKTKGDFVADTNLQADVLTLFEIPCKAAGKCEEQLSYKLSLKVCNSEMDCQHPRIDPFLINDVIWVQPHSTHVDGVSLVNPRYDVYSYSHELYDLNDTLIYAMEAASTLNVKQINNQGTPTFGFPILITREFIDDNNITQIGNLFITIVMTISSDNTIRRMEESEKTKINFSRVEIKIDEKVFKSANLNESIKQERESWSPMQIVVLVILGIIIILLSALLFLYETKPNFEFKSEEGRERKVDVVNTQSDVLSIRKIDLVKDQINI